MKQTNQHWLEMPSKYDLCVVIWDVRASNPELKFYIFIYIESYRDVVSPKS